LSCIVKARTSTNTNICICKAYTIETHPRMLMRVDIAIDRKKQHRHFRQVSHSCTSPCTPFVKNSFGFYLYHCTAPSCRFSHCEHGAFEAFLWWSKCVTIAWLDGASVS